MYTIKKTLNNNVAQAINDAGKECIIFGKGLAYGKTQGSKVEDCIIEDFYFLEKRDYSHIETMMASIPDSIIEVTNCIMKVIEEELNAKAEANTFFGLADHIHFAIERQKSGLIIASPLEYEVRRLYEKEVYVAERAIEIIHQQLDILLPKEEVVMIALHIVNSFIGGQDIDQAMTIIAMTNEILNIINFHYQIILDEKSLSVNRFMIHLKFLILKCLNHEIKMDCHYDDMYTLMANKDKKVLACVQKIVKYLEIKQGWTISQNDQLYLLIHVHRLIKEE